ncbi:MAG: hypothetical protein NC095_09930 [Muribaculum sp.]|nr:hypothetical protein [Muribaculum sp.]
MRYFIPMLLSILTLLNGLFASCSDNYGQEELSHVETIIEDKPDSAYRILSDLDRDKLTGKKQKARYALLMSMALDKNYIDTTTFDVLQPAIDYYLKKGTPDDKLKTYYYQGRIYQNKQEKDSALDSFVKGLYLADLCKDSIIIARTLVARSLLYHDFYDINSYTLDNLKAANIYKNLNIHDLEFDCLLNAINGSIHLNEKILADSILKICKELTKFKEISIAELKRYKLSLAIEFGSEHDILNILKNDFSNDTFEFDDILTQAYAYYKLKDYEKARQLLLLIENSNQPYDTLRFQSIYVSVMANLKNYEEAYHTYWQFSHRLDSINNLKFDQKSKSMVEKHKIELEATKHVNEKTQIIWGCIGCILILALIVLILSIFTRSNKIKAKLAIESEKSKILENEKLKATREKLILEKDHLILENKNLELERDKKALETENLLHRIQTLEEESESLKKILDSKEELPDEVRNVLKDREEMLNSLLASHISENPQYEEAYYNWVKRLTENTNDFMNTNRLAFRASHPQFIQYFEDHNLCISEINYVCLYALGLRGKEVGNYMKLRSHVNISSTIRKKLGIDKHETNLGIYVRRLRKSLS